MGRREHMAPTPASTGILGLTCHRGAQASIMWAASRAVEHVQNPNLKLKSKPYTWRQGPRTRAAVSRSRKRPPTRFSSSYRSPPDHATASGALIKCLHITST